MPSSSSHPTRTPARGTQTGCVQHASLFQDPLLETPPNANAAADVRRRYDELTRQASRVCEACPVLADCLFRAVVEHDVAGFAGATTPRQRTEIRRRLRVSVEPEDFDTLAGVSGRHRQVDHHEVVRLRRANPQESLEALAHRLGCSLSTVKRHLRAERRSPAAVSPVSSATPSVKQVVAAAAQVTGAVTVRRYAA
jgi:hypothetical protein